HFAQWLKRRRAGTQGRYPVFIFAAEGGGIYAAAGIGLLLSELQDQCPQFAEHIFAISAVSGGAIGATTFHALLDSPSSAPCRPTQLRAQNSMSSRLERVLNADHLSPIAALILPDVLGLTRVRGLDRAGALEWSLVCAFENRQNAGEISVPCTGGEFRGNG